MDQVLLVLTNLPDAESAESLAHALVDARLAACVNVLPAVRSVYRWQGKVESAQEATLLAKTTQRRYAQLEHAIRSAHPYDLPEIVALPVTAGLPAYLHWIAQETAPSQDA